MRRDAFLAALPTAGLGAEDSFESGLAAHIARSWGRCRTAHVPDRGPAPLPSAELADRRESACLLWRSAQPELDALGEYLVDPGCVALVADATGLVLDASDGGPLCGTDWSEAARGTNAIGTALHELAPLMVVGREHFLSACQASGGAAAPVFDSRGRLAGAMALAGPAARIDTQALALVKMAAAQVEHRMFARTHASERIHFHRRPALIGTPREGLILAEVGAIVGINRVAAGLLGGDVRNWLGRPVESVLGERWRRLIEHPGLLNAPDGRPWAVSVESQPNRRMPSASKRSSVNALRAAPVVAPPAPEPLIQPVAPPATPASLSQLRRAAMALALEEHGGHIAPAARSLGVGRSTLYRWLRDDPPRP